MRPFKHSLNFQRTLATKISPDALSDTMNLFDLNTLSYENLRFLLQLPVMQRQILVNTHLLFHFSKIPISSDQMMELLNSNFAPENTFALVRARYYRNPAFIPVIQNRLLQYSDENRNRALVTLSILAGKRFSLLDLGDLARRRMTSPFFFVECTNWNPRSMLSQVSETIKHEAIFNACLREKARTARCRLQESIESKGWFTMPLDSRDLSLVGQVIGDQK